MNAIKNSFRLKDKLGLFTIALAILWSPLTVWYLHIDAAARTPLVFFVLSLLLFYKDFQKYAWKMPIKLYVFVAFYMLINGLVKGSAAAYERDGLYLMCTNILEPVLTMMITIILARKNFNRTVRILSIVLLLYCFICLLNAGYDESERLNVGLNANEIAIHCAICIGLLLLQFSQSRRTKSWLFVIISLFPLYVILKTGSRMALTMVIIEVLFIWLSRIDLKNPKHIIGSVIAAIMIVLIGSYILNNTMIGERMMSTSEQGSELIFATGTFLDKFGDRGWPYYYSWPYFLQNPITGIGFHRWILYSPAELVFHSEYLVQYVECGLLSFIPYMVFLFWLLKLISKKVKTSTVPMDKTMSMELLGLLLAIFFSNFVLWSYDTHVVFIVYGLIFSYSKYVKRTKLS